MLPTPPSKALVAPLLPATVLHCTLADGAPATTAAAAPAAAAAVTPSQATTGTSGTATANGAGMGGHANGRTNSLSSPAGALLVPAAAPSAAAVSSVSSPPSALGGRCSTPISVHFRNLTAVLQDKDWRGRVTKEHTIVKNISARFEPGKLIGIMGGSGSGKTTLLNLLANRGGVRQSCKCSGQILFNDRPGDQFGRRAATTDASLPGLSDPQADISAQQSHNSVLENRIGYVLQQEYLLPHLSVLETLLYAAQLRLGRELSYAQKLARVEGVIRELNLKAVRDSLVGDETVRGISGGEKRRLSVAVQMLIDPSLLFLDEPTTGLDSFAALNIVETLATLAHSQGRCCVATIHQPRSSIYHGFDELLFMVRGSVVFQGTPAESVSFFDRHGYALPKNVNPADYLLDVLTIDGRTQIVDAHADAAAATDAQPVEAGSDAEAALIKKRERDSLARVRRLKRAFEAEQKTAATQTAQAAAAAATAATSSPRTASTSPPAAAPPLLAVQGASVAMQTWLLLRRTFLSLLRDRSYLFSQALASVFCALMLGLIYYDLPFDLAGIRSRTAATYMLTSLYFYLTMIFYVYKFSRDIPVADHEREDGMYGAVALVASSAGALFPFHVIFATGYIGIAYALIGLRPGAGPFFIAAAVALLQQHCCVSMALMCVCLQRSFAQASLIANSMFTFCGLSTGFLVYSDSIPVYLRWLQPLSYTWYAWRMLASSEYSGRQLPGCDADAQPPGACAEWDGDQILRANALRSDDYLEPTLALLAVWAVFTLVSLLALWLIPRRAGMAGEGAAGTGGAAGSEDVDECEYDLDLDPDADAEGTEGSTKKLPQGKPAAVAIGAYGALDQYDPEPAAPDAIVSIRPSPSPSPSASASARGGASASGVVFHDGDDEEMESPVHGARPESPRLINGVDDAPHHHRALSAVQSLSHSHGGRGSLAPLRPLITVSLCAISLEVVKRRALDLSCKSRRGDSGDGADAVDPPPSRVLRILDSVSATIEPGKLVVMMGASGAGKSTLLDILSHRSTLLSSMEGSVRFNGDVLAEDVWASVVGYVQQADHLLPFLTVEETLRFAARLRLPPDTSRPELELRVAGVIAELGLDLCKHTLVGSREVKGISGGEKRRLSIGIQMLTDPAVLVLDEPTSGLDSFSAFQIARTLLRIARRGRTVIASIHQPRSDVYALFDRVLLLAPGGHLVFHGDRDSVAPYFASMGLHCDPHVNPADFLLDNSSLDYRSDESERRTIARNETLVRQFRTVQAAGRMIGGNDKFRSVEEVLAITGAGAEGSGVSAALKDSSAAAAQAASNDRAMRADAGSDVPASVVVSADDHASKAALLLSASSSFGDSTDGGGGGKRSTSDPGAHSLPRSSSSFHVSGSGGEIVPVRRAPFVLAFRVLLHRSWLNFARQPLLVSARVGQILAFAIILMLYYTRLDGDQFGVQNRLGLMQQLTALLFIGMLNNIAVFPSERNIFYREYADRSVGTLPFFLSYTVSEVAFEVVGCMAFAIIAMFVIGMQASTSNFFVLFFVLFCTVNAGESFGILFCSLVFEAGISVSITNALFTFFTIQIGVFSLSMPAWLRGLNHISSLRFMAALTARNEFGGLTFDCTPGQLMPGPDGSLRCPFTNGEQILSLYEFDTTSDRDDLLCVAFLTLAYRLIALATLHWSARKKHFVA